MTGIYVAGFMTDGRRVALIRKRHPPALEGKLNGIGGQVDPEEGILTAMEREFREETGLKLTRGEWKRYARLQVGAGRVFEHEAVVHFFYNFDNHNDLSLLRTVTDEEIVVINIAHVNSRNALANVPWLIQMALSMERGERAKEFVVTEIYA